MLPMFLNLSMFDLILEALCLCTTYIAVRALYNLFFHPLAGFPGPKLTASSKLYEFYYDVLRGGQFFYEIQRMHELYGPERIATKTEPALTSSQDANSTRYQWFTNAAGSPTSTFATVGHDLHRTRRSALNPFFSKASVVKLEPLIHEKVEGICAGMDAQFQQEALFDFGAAYMSFALDTVSHYAFGAAECWNCLLEPGFSADWKEAIVSSFENATLIRYIPWLLMPLKMIPYQWITRVHRAMGMYFKSYTLIKGHVLSFLDAEHVKVAHHDVTIFSELRNGKLPAIEQEPRRLIDEANILMIAGGEAITQLLTIVSYHLLDNPHILVRLREELDNVMPRPDSPITWCELEKLPYLKPVSLCSSILLGKITVSVATKMSLFDEKTGVFEEQYGGLLYSYDSEMLLVQPWSDHAFRIRATKLNAFPEADWALEDKSKRHTKTKFIVKIQKDGATITNGDIVAHISQTGKLTIRNRSGKVLLEEFARNRRNILDSKCSAIEIEPREFKARQGTDEFHLTWRLESLDRDEKIYGMGQYQQPFLDLKGQDLELAHRNSQASVPFAVSSLGYGLLWNNPAVGRAILGNNVMSFEAFSTKCLDVWIVAGDSPAAIVESYAGVSGTVPMMPEYGLGFWQCKLRYQSQEELLEVAREYKRRNLPIDLIVIDYFHWPLQGDWKFDTTYWPDPQAMVKELESLGIELMVSIWPTVDRRSENYSEMLKQGYLVRTDKGIRITMDFEGYGLFYDATNPKARSYVWEKAKANYTKYGIKAFWLDVAEPEYTAYDFDNYRYWLGNNQSVGNVYPRDYARTFYDGQAREGQEDIVNLLRCAWAGSQKYGALVWSGDIASSWSSFRNQLAAGLNMGMAGIPWWTTDIGGFHGGNPDDEEYRELFVRWFQWGAFCPVMRLHGDREPRQPQQDTTGGATCRSGAPNEVWSYGPVVYKICEKYMRIREMLRDYTRELMRDAHERGSPVMRPLFYDFPKDEKCWSHGVEDQFMYGWKYLVAPVLSASQKKRSIYLPAGEVWRMLDSEQTFKGGRTVEIDCPMESMPVFVRQ
ncbi:hypothetical protein E4T38_06142 [Aureobasidium subglaciale]|nr:hypothetical protein E4T38_06142 [Aureobasidium subglaciale]KAI5219875.1 hypothetical protein E4T40_06163 [Aureobasidium subglaciale]KAI5223690.1 hypothetical protein E4T41_06035 [Aureobasidium subglaciale]KAI5260588.1 hypothetical protein E4T46_05897 [Aureobasidium subglaciale]